MIEAVNQGRGIGKPVAVTNGSTSSEIQGCLDVLNEEVGYLENAASQLLERLVPVSSIGVESTSKDPAKPPRSCALAREIEAHTERVKTIRNAINEAASNLCI